MPVLVYPHKPLGAQAVGDTVFALVDGAVHRSSDGGKEWTDLGRLPPFQVVVCGHFSPVMS